MAGGKTRALCEEAFDLALEYPGILLPLFRQKHTAIINTTRKTFFEQVLPAELRPHVKVKFSQGEDYVRLWNKSEIHFVGLDDPIKWFSSELGAVGFDEAHEIAEDDVIKIRSRLRQRCPDCVRTGSDQCEHMPRCAMITFNPAHPGHWLQNWFITGSYPTEFGFRKDALYIGDATESAGACEFVIAKATDNPYIPSSYVSETLASMPPAMRRRYLEGLWEYVDGSCFFDIEALSQIQTSTLSEKPALVGDTTGDLKGGRKDPVRLNRRGNGPLQVFQTPVREHEKGTLPERCHRCVGYQPDETRCAPHRYVVAVDASSGTAQDWSGIQVVSVDELDQMAELQAKLDPDLLAVEAFRLACVYNGALIAPEVTGGWGFAVTKACQKLIPAWKGPLSAKPRLYTRPITDRLSQKWTDKLGFDTNLKTRAQVLSTLEEAVREGSVGIHGQRTVAELAAFVYTKDGKAGDWGKPQARDDANDDLVMSLAIGVQVALGLPRDMKPLLHKPRKPQFAATGY